MDCRTCITIFIGAVTDGVLPNAGVAEASKESPSQQVPFEGLCVWPTDPQDDSFDLFKMLCPPPLECGEHTVSAGLAFMHLRITRFCGDCRWSGFGKEAGELPLAKLEWPPLG